MTGSDSDPSPTPHLPVLIDAILERVDPAGTWIDGTFGAGGYTRAFLKAGCDKIIGIDRDPTVFDMAKDWSAGLGEKLHLVAGKFGDMERLSTEFQPVDGVVLDLGVSSMQVDQAQRGFSFLRDGPLDMRMSDTGPSAADLVNQASEGVIADILFQYGEERASRRIARAIVTERPITTTRQLAEVVASCLPRTKTGQSHPATRSFQAIRIAVNDELGQLISGLEAAERVLKPGGYLAVVSFHSLEDRVVKKFVASRAARSGGGSRYAPQEQLASASFEPVTRKAVSADDAEIARNPRARSAKLRVAQRTSAAAWSADRAGLGLPRLTGTDFGQEI
ncbi:MAG: 16S rRNA (cytosine(1402)-N(4))-methyltransferase RsmH [Pseudomonadota bacterium]